MEYLIDQQIEGVHDLPHDLSDSKSAELFKKGYLMMRDGGVDSRLIMSMTATVKLPSKIRGQVNVVLSRLLQLDPEKRDFTLIQSN